MLRHLVKSLFAIDQIRNPILAITAIFGIWDLHLSTALDRSCGLLINRNLTFNVKWTGKSGSKPSDYLCLQVKILSVESRNSVWEIYHLFNSDLADIDIFLSCCITLWLAEKRCISCWPAQCDIKIRQWECPVDIWTNQDAQEFKTWLCKVYEQKKSNNRAWPWQLSLACQCSSNLNFKYAIECQAIARTCDDLWCKFQLWGCELVMHIICQLWRSSDLCLISLINKHATRVSKSKLDHHAGWIPIHESSPLSLVWC